MTEESIQSWREMLIYRLAVFVNHTVLLPNRTFFFKKIAYLSVPHVIFLFSQSICQQKNVIMQCLESEQCDITTLNKEIAVLQDMQDQYSKLEYETTRNLWLDSVAGSSTKASNINNMDDTDFDEQFSALVEQEVCIFM